MLHPQQFWMVIVNDKKSKAQALCIHHFWNVWSAQTPTQMHEMVHERVIEIKFWIGWFSHWLPSTTTWWCRAECHINTRIIVFWCSGNMGCVHLDLDHTARAMDAIWQCDSHGLVPRYTIVFGANLYSVASDRIDELCSTHANMRSTATNLKWQPNSRSRSELTRGCGWELETIFDLAQCIATTNGPEPFVVIDCCLLTWAMQSKVGRCNGCKREKPKNVHLLCVVIK